MAQCRNALHKRYYINNSQYPQMVADIPQEEDVLQEPEEPMEEEPEDEQDKEDLHEDED
jgi:hypothetical protein